MTTTQLKQLSETPMSELLNREGPAPSAVNPGDLRRALAKVSEFTEEEANALAAASAYANTARLLVVKQKKFKFHYDAKQQRVVGSLFLVNHKGNGPVAFKLKTNNANRFLMSPRAGVLLDGEVMEVRAEAKMRTEDAKSGQDQVLLQQFPVDVHDDAQAYLLRPRISADDVSAFFKVGGVAAMHAWRVPVEFDEPAVVINGPKSVPVPESRGRQLWRWLAGYIAGWMASSLKRTQVASDALSSHLPVVRTGAAEKTVTNIRIVGQCSLFEIFMVAVTIIILWFNVQLTSLSTAIDAHLVDVLF